MTYCVGIALKAGMVFCSDSRTHAGVDVVSSYSKMHTFGIDGERQFALVAAGNLATSQGVILQLKKDIEQRVPVNLMTIPHMDDVADYIGKVSVAQQQKHGTNSAVFDASFIVGGQIKDAAPEVRLIYPQGNHITTSHDTPFLQIGESKYGKPILDRIVSPDSSLETAAQCTLVSMDSTMHSNLSVGPPIEVLVYERDSLMMTRRYRFDEHSDYLRTIKKSWDAALKNAFKTLPPISWGHAWDRKGVDHQGS